ncbi:MAG: hypothetical protein AAB672_01070 [Patescibacteria group bacterium]
MSTKSDLDGILKEANEILGQKRSRRERQRYISFQREKSKTEKTIQEILHLLPAKATRRRLAEFLEEEARRIKEELMLETLSSRR